MDNNEDNVPCNNACCFAQETGNKVEEIKEIPGEPLPSASSQTPSADSTTHSPHAPQGAQEMVVDLSAQPGQHNPVPLAQEEMGIIYTGPEFSQITQRDHRAELRRSMEQQIQLSEIHKIRLICQHRKVTVQRQRCQQEKFQCEMRDEELYQQQRLLDHELFHIIQNQHEINQISDSTMVEEPMEEQFEYTLQEMPDLEGIRHFRVVRKPVPAAIPNGVHPHPYEMAATPGPSVSNGAGIPPQFRVVSPPPPPPFPDARRVPQYAAFPGPSTSPDVALPCIPGPSYSMDLSMGNAAMRGAAIRNAAMGCAGMGNDEMGSDAMRSAAMGNGSMGCGGPTRRRISQFGLPGPSYAASAAAASAALPGPSTSSRAPFSMTNHYAPPLPPFRPRSNCISNPQPGPNNNQNTTGAFEPEVNGSASNGRHPLAGSSREPPEFTYVGRVGERRCYERRPKHDPNNDDFNNNMD